MTQNRVLAPQVMPGPDNKVVQMRKRLFPAGEFMFTNTSVQVARDILVSSGITDRIDLTFELEVETGTAKFTDRFFPSDWEESRIFTFVRQLTGLQYDEFFDAQLLEGWSGVVRIEHKNSRGRTYANVTAVWDCHKIDSTEAAE